MKFLEGLFQLVLRELVTIVFQDEIPLGINRQRYIYINDYYIHGHHCNYGSNTNIVIFNINSFKLVNKVIVTHFSHVILHFYIS